MQEAHLQQLTLEAIVINHFMNWIHSGKPMHEVMPTLVQPAGTHLNRGDITFFIVASELEIHELMYGFNKFAVWFKERGFHSSVTVSSDRRIVQLVAKDKLTPIVIAGLDSRSLFVRDDWTSVLIQDQMEDLQSFCFLMSSPPIVEIK